MPLKRTDRNDSNITVVRKTPEAKKTDSQRSNDVICLGNVEKLTCQREELPEINNWNAKQRKNPTIGLISILKIVK